MTRAPFIVLRFWYDWTRQVLPLALSTAVENNVIGLVTVIWGETKSQGEQCSTRKHVTISETFVVSQRKAARFQALPGTQQMLLGMC